MIPYDNTQQFAIIFQMAGSVLPQCVPVGMLSFGVGLALALIRMLQRDADSTYCPSDSVWVTCKNLKDSDSGKDEGYLADPFALQVIAYTTGFLLVVRTNMALSRWMEGISDVQLMLSKWADAFDALSAFFSGRQGATEDQLKDILMFRVRVAHWFSLMSCLAFATLRNHGILPPIEEIPIKELFDDTPDSRVKSFAVTRINQSRMRPSSRPSGVAVSEGLEPRNRGSTLSGPAMKKGVTVSVKRNSTASEAGASQTSRPSATSFWGASDLMNDLDLLVLSLPSAEEVSLLQQCNDKPNAICLWIIQGIMIMVRRGLLDMPAPIVSRVFQELSSGMLGFNQAHKVAMVPFPFPFAQMVSLLLLFIYVSIPFYIDAFTQNVVITPLVSLLIPMVYCALNTIAVELEEPFGTDLNDVDIEDRHEEFLWLLVDVLRAPKMCPIDEDKVLEEEILRGAVKNCSLLSPEISEFMRERSQERSREPYS